MTATFVDPTTAEHLAARALRVAFETSPVATAVCDSGGRICDANDAFADLLGRLTLELIGSFFSELLVADDSRPDGPPLDGEVLLRHADGAAVAALLHVEQVIDVDGGICGHVVTATLSETVPATALAVLHKEIDNRDSLLATVAHDLRGPIGTVVAAIETASECEDPDDIARCVAIAGRAAGLAERLSRDLLDSTAIESGKLELDYATTRVRPLIEDLAAATEARGADRGVCVVVDVDPAVSGTHADADRIAQVLSNLGTNALKFSPDRGTILLSAAPHTPGFVRISVRDDGPGLDSADAERIFDRHVQLRGNGWDTPHRGGGLGIGLHVARSLVEAHGGSIWVESEPGRGATFSFTIPAVPLPPERR